MQKETILSLKELDGWLRKIDSVFSLQNIIDRNIERDAIVDYYRKSSAVYKYLHSYQGCVHMALSPDGIFRKRDFYAQLNEIAEQINLLQVKKVLELGCGKGFNTLFLAGRFPEVHFSGIDITDKHLAVAQKKSSAIRNLNIAYGDFHKLHYADASFDLIFELEAVCHARNTRQVLSEVFRVLKKGGRFVLYDGFRRSNFEMLPDNLKKAAIVIEKSLAVDRFEKVDCWIKTAEEEGFALKVKDDLSRAIMPNLARLQIWALRYFSNYHLSKILLGVFKKHTLLNCAAVLLMPITLHNGAHGYYNIVLEK